MGQEKNNTAGGKGWPGPYLAHTERERIQLLKEHLERVKELAEGFGAAFGAGRLAGYLGLCHDIGKYSEKAQKRLQGGPKVDHATAGGQVVNALLQGQGPLYANCVLGHHSGLLDWGSPADQGGEATVYGRLRKEVEDYSAYATEITLPMPQPPPLKPLGKNGFTLSFNARMLFSCVVDADRLDTEWFAKNGKVGRGGFDTIPQLLEKLERHLAGFGAPKTDINRKRWEIQAQAVGKAEGERGLYSLTVPTGGGKTLCSLAFALGHAVKHGMERVIYVIPYTSIIEQTAQEFRNILGDENVLEHHGNVQYDDQEESDRRKQFATENWDCPVVVTTNVQFFESLFGCRTSVCRKLHNIANSVLIFDEAQMLPVPYLKPCVQAIAELVYNYRCTAVLCTATQPSLDKFFPPQMVRKEICSNPVELQDFFRRVTFQHGGYLDDEGLAERLRGCEQVLCIVNSRKQAQNLYGLLGEGEGNYHLSTLLYPLHRRELLEEIRKRLKKKLPCRVVSTSLVEAGVYVDFPTVYRAQTGLDSIIQAAGRCNREGRRKKEDSVVWVFEPDSRYKFPSSLELNLAAYREAQRRSEQPDTLEAIGGYFRFLYAVKGEGLDAKRIINRLEEGMAEKSVPFQTIAKDFRLIEENTCAVIIPIEDEAKELVDQLRRGEYSKQLMQKLGLYSVNVYEKHFNELYRSGVIEPLEEKLAVLAELEAYSSRTGLASEVETGKGLFV